MNEESQEKKENFQIKLLEKGAFSFNEKIENKFRLIFINKGRVILKINNKIKTCIAPALCCLNGYDDVIEVEGKFEELYALYFHPSYINKSLTLDNIKNKDGLISTPDKLDADNFNIFVHTKNDDGIIEISELDALKIKDLILRIKREFEEKPDRFWPCRSRAGLLELLFYLMNIYNLQPESSKEINFVSDEELINKIIHYILTNLHNKITIEELTKAFNSNRTTLSAYFKKHTGSSIIEYINRIRINLAERILRDTTLPLKEIIEKTGFNDSTHFIRVFKKINNQTPLEFRSNAKKKGAVQKAGN